MSVQQARINNTAKYPNRRDYGDALPVYSHLTLAPFCPRLFRRTWAPPLSLRLTPPFFVQNQRLNHRR